MPLSSSPLTLAEKILSQKQGKEIRANSIAIVNIDMAIVQDGTGTLTFDMIEELVGRDFVKDPKRAMVTIDHTGPSPRLELSNVQIRLREFAKTTGAYIEDVGEGISHLRLSESYVSPGDVVVGADSHTNTAAGMGAYATGMGSTDVAVAMALGKQWFRVPETIRFDLEGKLEKGVYSKDIILHIIGKIGEDGAIYKSMEYGGPALSNLSMDERFTISSMAQEAGAVLGIFPSDEVTRRFMAMHRREAEWKEIFPDEGASYERELTIELDELEPYISLPHNPGKVEPVSDVIEKQNVQVNQVFIGTCTNGRLEDMEAVAKVLAGRRAHHGTRLLINPGSRWVMRKALEQGLIEIFEEAGAVVGVPGCGACPGIHLGVLGDGEICVAAQNRNFMGRMGNPRAFVYLASPATAAACAIEGRIADPRKYL